MMHRPGYWKRAWRHAEYSADLAAAERNDAIVWANNSLQHSRELMERCARLIELATRLGATREQINEIATRQMVTWPPQDARDDDARQRAFEALEQDDASRDADADTDEPDDA